MHLIKALVVGMLPVLLTACGGVLYEKTDVHLILPCYKDKNTCMKQMTNTCMKEFSGKVLENETRDEDVPVVYVLCRPAQNQTAGDAKAES